MTVFSAGGAYLLGELLLGAKSDLYRAREVDDLPSSVAEELDTALAAIGRAQTALEQRLAEGFEVRP
jgi:hypothetical protein